MNPMTLMLIMKAVDLLATGLSLVPEVKAKYEATSAKIKQFIEEDREPTREEFDALIAETTSLTDQIREAVEAKRTSA